MGWRDVKRRLHFVEYCAYLRDCVIGLSGIYPGVSLYISVYPGIYREGANKGPDKKKQELQQIVKHQIHVN